MAENLYNAVYNPDVLSCIANLSNDEVFTPPEVANVITQLEPELFRKVTGLEVKDFELLVSLNVFNEALMNDAVYKFKRYEDASLSYTGIDRHAGEKVGLFSTTISREAYDAMAGLMAESMKADAPKPEDIPQRPMFVNISAEEESPVRAVPASKRPAIVSPPAKTVIPTYRPAFVPPVPVKVEEKPKVTVDVTDVASGTEVVHKAFGKGVVKEFSRFG